MVLGFWLLTASYQLFAIRPKPFNVNRSGRAALESAGLGYELLTFPDEGHGISRQENLEKLIMKLAGFFEDSFDV